MTVPGPAKSNLLAAIRAIRISFLAGQSAKARNVFNIVHYTKIIIKTILHSLLLFCEIRMSGNRSGDEEKLDRGDFEPVDSSNNITKYFLPELDFSSNQDNFLLHELQPVRSINPDENSNNHSSVDKESHLNISSAHSDCSETSYSRKHNDFFKSPSRALSRRNLTSLSRSHRRKPSKIIRRKAENSFNPDEHHDISAALSPSSETSNHSDNPEQLANNKDELDHVPKIESDVQIDIEPPPPLDTGNSLGDSKSSDNTRHVFWDSNQSLAQPQDDQRIAGNEFDENIESTRSFINRSNHVRRSLKASRRQKMSSFDSDNEFDDTWAVLDQANQEETRSSNKKIEHENHNGSVVRFALHWFWRLVKTLIVCAVFLAPGTICLIIGDEPRCLFFNVNLFRYCLMIAMIIFGYFVASFIEKLVVLIIQRTPYLGTHFLYYVNNLSRPTKWVIATVFVNLSWLSIFAGTELLNPNASDPRVPTVRFYVERVINCMVVTAVAFLVEAIVLRILAINFYRGAYYKRIKDALFAEYVITRIFDKGHKKRGVAGIVNNVKNLVRQNNSAKETSGAKFSLFSKIKNREESAEILDELPVTEKELLDKRPFSTHRFAAYVEFIKNFEFSFKSGVFKYILLHKKSKEIREKADLTGVDEFSDEYCLGCISHAQASALLANLVFNTLKSTDRESVNYENFSQYLGDDLAHDAFEIFDGNWNGELTEKEIHSTLLSISRERKALMSALNDAEIAVSKLDSALTGVTAFICFILYFIVFGVDAEKVLLTLSSFLLASAFAISSSAKALLESIIFIFVIHPFDIGDRVIIDKLVYTVVKVNLLTSVLKRYDNSLFYFSNSVLSQKPILNLRRSPDQFDLITIHVSFYTPVSILKTFEKKMGEYLQKASEHFHEKFEVEYQELENSNRMILRVWVQHRNNFQNIKRYRKRHGRLLLRIKKICEQLDIEYELPVQRVVHENLDGLNAETPAEFAPIPSQFVSGGGGMGMNSNKESWESKAYSSQKPYSSYQDGIFQHGSSPFSYAGNVIDGSSLQNVNRGYEQRMEEDRITKEIQQQRNH